MKTLNRRLAIAAIVVGFAPTGTTAQTVKPAAVALGAVVVVIPPPEGFANVLNVPAFRERFVDDPNSEMLALFVPETVVKTFKAEQDLDATARVMVSRKFRAEDYSKEFDEIANGLGGPIKDQRERIAEVEKRRGVAISQPVNLGLFDRTPQSASTMVLMGVNQGQGSVNLVVASSIVLVKTRLLNLQMARRFETEADKTALEEATKAWIKRIVSANQ